MILMEVYTMLGCTDLALGKNARWARVCEAMEDKRWPPYKFYSHRGMYPYYRSRKRFNDELHAIHQPHWHDLYISSSWSGGNNPQSAM